LTLLPWLVSESELLVLAVLMVVVLSLLHGLLL
jgi:hypothetical protein